MRLAATRSSISAGSTGPPEAGAGEEGPAMECLRGSRRARRGPASWASAAEWHPSRSGWSPRTRWAILRESGGGRGEGGMNFVNFMKLEGFSLPGFDPVTASVTLPWWAAAVVAALLVASWILALLRGGPAILVGSLVG